MTGDVEKNAWIKTTERPEIAGTTWIGAREVEPAYFHTVNRGRL